MTRKEAEDLAVKHIARIVHASMAATTAMLAAHERGERTPLSGQTGAARVDTREQAREVMAWMVSETKRATMSDLADDFERCAGRDT